MPIFQKRTDNSKKKTCQGFQNFTFQFIYAQRSKKCMMVCNSKLCKNSMHHYMQQYAIIHKDCIYLTCIEKRIKKVFFSRLVSIQKMCSKNKSDT